MNKKFTNYQKQDLQEKTQLELFYQLIFMCRERYPSIAKFNYILTSKELEKNPCIHFNNDILLKTAERKGHFSIVKFLTEFDSKNIKPLKENNNKIKFKIKE